MNKNYPIYKTTFIDDIARLIQIYRFHKKWTAV